MANCSFGPNFKDTWGIPVTMKARITRGQSKVENP